MARASQRHLVFKSWKEKKQSNFLVGKDCCEFEARISYSSKTKTRAGEMSLSIKCLLPKHEFWSLVHIQEARCSCVCLYTICLYIICVYTLCMSSIYCICYLYMTCLGTIASVHYMTVYCICLNIILHYISLDTIWCLCTMCLYAICLYIRLYTIYTLWSLYNICVCYMAIHYMYLYNTYVYTLYKFIYFVWCLYIIYVYELCVSMHCMSIYYIWYLYTYMCLYTLELGKQTDPWRLLASLANQWTPGSVKDTRKSDREGLLTLTSGLHTYTQIRKQHTSSCHTHKPALLGAVKVISWLWEF